MKILGCRAAKTGAQAKPKNKRSPATARGTPVKKLRALKGWRLSPAHLRGHLLGAAAQKRLPEFRPHGQIRERPHVQCLL